MALFHSGFNFLNICFVIGFVPLLAKFVGRSFKGRKNRELPASTLTEIREFSALLFRFMDFWSGLLGSSVTSADMDTAFQLEKQIDQAHKKLRREAMLRMQSSGEAIKAEMLYIDILNNMESIGNHLLNILQALRHAE